jgi:hypothetical protein
MLRSLDNRLADGGDVSLTSRAGFTSRKFPGIHFHWRLSQPRAISQLERLGHIF